MSARPVLVSLALLAACGPAYQEQPQYAQPQPQYAQQQPQYAQQQPQPQYAQQPQPYAQPQYVAPPAAPPGYRTLQGAGWSFTVPANWEDVPIEPPVTVSVRDPQPFAGFFHVNANLVQEPYAGGDGQAYAQANLDAMRAAATVISMVPAQVGPQRGMDVEAAWPNLNPPIRTIQRFAVRGGMGYVLTCSGPLNMFENTRPTCNQILSTFWVAP